MTTNGKNLISDEMIHAALIAAGAPITESQRVAMRAAIEVIVPMLAQAGDAVSERPKFTLSQEFVDRIQSEQSYDSPNVIGADIGHGSPIMQVVENYFDEYEFRCDDGVYTPNADERMLIKDAVYGLIEDEDFLRVITLMHKTPPHDDGKVARDVELCGAAEHAAKNLPEGYEVRLCVEKGAGWIELIGPQGSIDVEHNDDGLVYEMADAVFAAIKEQRSLSQSTGSSGGNSFDSALFEQTILDFEDWEETETPYETLLQWANEGLLECERFQVTKKGRAAISKATGSHGDDGEKT